ncbi:MAG: ABC transporter ATP-binding protein, partial [Hyphomicrobiales bacterium]
ALRAGRVEEMLKVVQCEHLADRYPPELSGGQQQRISLARALASRPSLLLLDEPLSNLDVLLRVDLRAQLRLLHTQLGFTAVYVTHDQDEALALGSRVAIMRAGKIEQVGDPLEVYRAPATEYVADFLGARNKFFMVLSAGTPHIDGEPLRGIAAAGADGDYTIRARPNDLALRRAGTATHDAGIAWLSGGHLIEILPGANADEYVVERQGTRLYASVAHESVDVRPGDSVDIGLDLANVHAYCQDTLSPVFLPSVQELR